MKRCALAMACLLLGCATTGPSADVEGVPNDLSVLVEMNAAADQKFTSIELRPSGDLYFVGGQAARYNGTREKAATLTADQFRQVWAVIRQYDLLDASGQWFPREEHVLWRVDIRGNGRHNRFKTADNDVPGVQELHDLLFGYQAAARYNLPGIGGADLPQKIKR